MKKLRMTIWIVTTVLMMAVGQSFGTPIIIQFKDGGTHNINYTIDQDVMVDYLAPGMQTTVNLLNGGDIRDPYKLQGYNASRINISGGEVHNLYAYDSSQVTMSGGSVYNLYASDSSQITMSGGSGSVGYSKNLYATDNSQITMSGGSMSYLWAQDNSQVTMSGGIIGESIALYGQAIFAIDGTNFAIDGTPFGYGEITSIFGGSYSNDPFRRLTGTLANGDIINNQFRIGETAKMVLIPEPASAAIMTLAGLFFALKRKQR